MYKFSVSYKFTRPISSQIPPYLEHRYLMDIVKKQWCNCGGSICRENPNHLIGDEHTLIEFNLTNPKSNLFELTLKKLNENL